MIKNNYTIGVEEEYMICNPHSGELVNKADLILNNIPSNLSDRFSYELLLSEIESNTSICENINDSISEIAKHRTILKQIGDKNNYKIGISGTHPTASPKDQTFVNNDSYNWVSEQLQYYAKRNITFSLHVHIGLDSQENIIKVTNLLRRWIAPMLAISANSPFFEGVLTGMQSSRTFQFGTFPRTHIPSFITNVDEYKKIQDLYIISKTMSKPRQIWWKIRPHLEFNTVEFRVCDAQRSLSRVAIIVALIQALVHSIVENDIKVNKDYNYELLQDGLWKAAKYGLNCNVIDVETEKVISMVNMVKNMINYCSKSINYFGTANIIKNIDDILVNGTEASFQIKTYKEGGFDKLKTNLINQVDYN